MTTQLMCATADTDGEESIALPTAPYYVIARDSFMSGWGAARGRANWVILPCDDLSEAEVVLANVRGRSEMLDEAITSTPPARNSRRIYSLMTKRGGASRWYVPGSWSE